MINYELCTLGERCSPFYFIKFSLCKPIKNVTKFFYCLFIDKILYF